MGTAILDVVPEGTEVNEGDIVAELDPSNLLQELEQQKIQISSAASCCWPKSRTRSKAQEIAKREYLEGLFVTQEKGCHRAVLGRAGQGHGRGGMNRQKNSTRRRLFRLSRLKARMFALEEATNNFNAAQTKLTTLRELTKQKELTLLEAAIDSAEASVKAERLQLEQQRQKNLEKQIANCTIRATAAGQVVYANEPEYYRSGTYSPFVVMPGALVRERQAIAWLPNADEMQVRATVNEAHVTTVRPGMPVSIRVDGAR